MKNKILNIVGYIVIISQIFSIKIPVLDMRILGYSLKYILFYSFIFWVISKWIIKIILQKKIKVVDIFIQTFLFLPFLVGVIQGWKIENILLESVLFVMPIAVYAWCQISDLKRETYISVFLSTVVVGAIISVLVAMRVIETDIWAAKGQLVRAAGAVDSTIFLGGLIISYIMLFVIEDQKYKKKGLLVISFLSSCIGILFSQSRARIAIAIAFIVISIIYNMFNKKSKFGNMKIIIISFITIIAVMIYAPEIFEQIIEQIQGRFQTFNDVNISYRKDETNLQIQEFLKSPVLGLGWGSRSQYDAMYVHNVYSAILMHGGIVGFSCFTMWMLKLFQRNLFAIKRKLMTCETITCFIVLSLIIVLNFTNAGIALCGGYFMLMYVFICDKHDYRD